jgi:hypothetical protein
VLADFVNAELEGFPLEIAARAISAALQDAEAVQLGNIQDGSAGRGRGGISSLVKYVRKALRPTAADMLRADEASAAKNRSERFVQEERHHARLRGFQRSGGSRRAPVSSDDVMEAAFGS